jgi:DHA1 family bicyclomycin/chloramphenicol resistance-like MFS transporter
VIGWTSIPLLIALLVWAVVPFGFITPTGTSLAMERSGNRAGSASGLLGAGMFLIGGFVSPLSGWGNPALIMSALMLAFSTGIAIVTIVLSRKRPM